MLDGRVKTLHPKIHGGLLADRAKESHRADLDTYGIEPFDLVVSNLYPFLERPDIETIDIGGPAMTRAAAKNYAWVTIVTSPDQYGPLVDELRANDGKVGPRPAASFAREAFARTAAYDAAIVQWFERDVHASRAPRSRARPHRRDAALRREPAPARRRATGGAARRAGGTAWSSTAASRSRTSTTTTPTPRGCS